MTTPRKRPTFGKCHINDGVCMSIDETKQYEIDYTRKFYIFDVVPMGKPRMTQSDKWKTNPNHADINKRQRDVVARYWQYKNTLLLQANQMGFELGNVLDAVYLIPMPNSWSKKKKEKHLGLPIFVKPDTDNITKGIKDIFCKNDSHIWREIAEKRWAYAGSILIYK